MNFFDLDKNPNTLENDLVNRVRCCWKKRPYPDNYGRNNLKNAIQELRTFRTNREITPELHAKLDKEAVDCFNSGGLLGYTEKAWHTYCHNKHTLTRTSIDEPIQESLIEGLPVTTEQPKGRVRTRPPAEKITKDYFTRAYADIEAGELTPYLPVRQMCRFIVEAAEQQRFINQVRHLAKEREDDPDYSTEYRRIHRVATRILTELDEIKNNGTQLDFFTQLNA